MNGDLEHQGYRYRGVHLRGHVSMHGFFPPTDGSCTVVVGWQIDVGSHDGISLDLPNAVLLAHSQDRMKDGDWKVALYTDDCADEVQN